MQGNQRAEQWRWVTYFDSESNLERRTETIRHDPRLICATFVDRGQRNRREVDYSGSNLTEAFYRDLSDSVYAHTTQYCLAHNVGYDLNATRGIRHLVGLGWRVESLYEKGLTYILRLTNSNQRRLVFLSSTQYWTSPLRDVAPLFGLKKLETDSQTQDFEELRRYCRQDTLILERAMEWLQDFIHDSDVGGMAMTLPSLAMKAFRHKFMPYPPVIHNYEPAMLLERASYHGGRTEAWFIGKISAGKIYKVDANSLYPSRMRECLHPVRLRKLYPEGSVELLHKLIDDNFLIADVSIRTQLPSVPVKREKLLFPIGTFSTVLTSHELRLLAPEDVLAVRAVAAYEQAPIFRGFVDYFYNERLKAIAAGETAKATLLKLIMNALYGKFGQQSTEWVRIGEAPPDEVRAEDILLPDGKRIRMRTFGGATWVNDGAVMESFESFPAIASSVTSAGRALLWEYVLSAGVDNVFYMDTDSLFVNQEGYDRLAAAGHLDPAALGKLKLEKQSEDVEIHGAKQYRFGTERRHKGIPADAEIVDGKAAVWTWPKTATWLRDGRLDGFENRRVLKSLDTHYTKGRVVDGTGGRVAPIELTDAV